MTKKRPAGKKAAAHPPRKKAAPPGASRSKAARTRRPTPASGSHPEPAPVPAARPGEARRRHASREAAEVVIEAALDKNALVPVLIDVSERASYTDYIGVVSGRSDRQVDAIAENVTQVMKERGWHLIGREGTGNGRWTLLDFGDVVLHIFYHPVREVYDIEGLWIDAPRVPLQVPPEAQLAQSDALYL